MVQTIYNFEKSLNQLYSDTNVFTSSVSYIYNTFSVSALICHIGIYLIITNDNWYKHSPKYGIWAKLYSKKLLVAFTSCVMIGITITPQYKNMFIELILSSLAYNSYVYTSTCMRTRFGVYITDTHTCLCKLSCTCLVHTQVLCMRVSMSSILHAHACIYMSEMKIVSCQVHGARLFSQV